MSETHVLGCFSVITLICKCRHSPVDGACRGTPSDDLLTLTSWWEGANSHPPLWL